MQNQFQQQEQNHPSVAPVNPTTVATEIVSAQQIVVEPQAQTEQSDALLGFVKKQVRRFAGWTTAAILLGEFAIFPLLKFALNYQSFRRNWHVKVHFDFNLASLSMMPKFNTVSNSSLTEMEHGHYGTITLTVSAITPLLLALGSGVCVALARRRRARLTNALDQCEDVRAVGALVKASTLWDKKIRSHAKAALIRLLPRMRQEDASLLSHMQRGWLRALLSPIRWSRTPYDRELALAILEAYPRIGDGSELLTVRWLARGKGRAAGDAGLQEAAQRYVDEWDSRLKAAQENETLLRASSATASAPETLLRPAEGVAPSDPRQLLRPGARDEEA